MMHSLRAEFLQLDGTTVGCKIQVGLNKHILTRLASTSRIITPLIRVKNPSYPFIRQFIGVIFPFITSRGAHLGFESTPNPS